MTNDIVELARRVVEANVKVGRSIVLAESCTGGLVAGAITDIPGSSAVFDRGFVTYSNESKVEALGVPLDIIEAFGAVSIATAFAMAKGALERSGADVAVAISGIAGPSGGTLLKPVGTVVFARAIRGETEQTADERLFKGEDRAGVRRQATLCALELLLP
ncbi:MAG: CinA family protein [Alteraurantiacibacter sp.]